MADPSPRRKRRALRLAMAVLVLLALAGAVLWEILPAVVEEIAKDRLAAMGLASPELTVRRIGIGGAELTGVALGDAGELTAREIQLGYTLPDLFEGRIDDIAIRGATLRARLGPEGLSLGSLDPLLAGGRDAGGAAVALPPVRLEDARVELETPWGPVALAGGGTITLDGAAIRASLDIGATAPQGAARGAVELQMRDSVIEATLRLADSRLSLPNLLDATATGDATLRIADGQIAALTGSLALAELRLSAPEMVGLGPLTGTLDISGGASGWRAALALAGPEGLLSGELHLATAALDLDEAAVVALHVDAAAAAPVWPLLGIPAPSAGSARVSLVTELAPSAVLAAIGDSASPAFTGSMTVEIADAAFPGAIRSLSLVGGFDAALQDDVLRLEGAAPILGEAAFAPDLLREAGIPEAAWAQFTAPLAVTLALSAPAELKLGSDGTSVSGALLASVDLADGDRLADLDAAGTAFISGSGALSYELPSLDINVTLPKESTVPGATLSIAGSARGSAAENALQGDGSIALAASAPHLAAAGFSGRDVSVELPLSLHLADGQLRFDLTDRGAIAVTRLSGATPLTLDGPVRLALTASDAPLLAVDFRPADGPRATLDLAAGPLRLSGSIGTEEGPLPATASLSRLRLAGSLDGSAWSARLTARGGDVGLPSYAMAATDLDITVDLASEAGPRIALDASLAHQGIPAYVVPLTARLEAHEVRNGWAFTGSAKDAFGRLSLTIAGRHDLTRGAGSATLKLTPIEFLPNLRQPEDFAPWLAGYAEDVSGTVALAGDVSWTSELITSNLEIALRDLSATTAAATIERVNGVIAVDGLAPFSTPPGQQVAVALIDAGLPLTDGLLTFQVAPGPHLEIAGGTLHLAGGTVELEPLTLDPRDGRSEAVLQVQGVELGELLALAGVNGLTGSGRMSGRIPVAVEDGDVIITAGELNAEAPGFLSYAPLSPPAALQGQGETVSLALSALTNFQYQALRLTVDRQAGGEMTVAMHVRGNNPDFYDGYPVEFNLNVTGALDRVLRDSLAGYRIPDTIEERLNEFAQ